MLIRSFLSIALVLYGVVGEVFADDHSDTHALGCKVAAHAHAASGVNAALRACVGSIEHFAFIDEESVQLLKETGIHLVAALSVGDQVLQIANDENSGTSDGVRTKAREAIPIMMTTAKMMGWTDDLGTLEAGKIYKDKC